MGTLIGKFSFTMGDGSKAWRVEITPVAGRGGTQQLTLKGSDQ